MITDMTVFNPRVSTSPIPIVAGSEETDPIQIKKIDGLGPIKASVNVEQYGSIDGTFYKGSSVGSRNIVITVGLNPDWTTQSFELLRSYLYEYFMTKSQVTLQFASTHLPDVEITGYVESCEPNLFALEPEYQISIICPRGEFVATTYTVVEGTTIAFGDTTTTTEIDYEGSLDAGFIIEVTPNVSVLTASGNFKMQNQNQVTESWIVGNTLIDVAEVLQVSTVQGDKYAQEVDAFGVGTSILGYLGDGSIWLQLKPGTNLFQAFHAVPGQDWIINYKALYGGL